MDSFVYEIDSFINRGQCKKILHGDTDVFFDFTAKIEKAICTEYKNHIRSFIGNKDEDPDFIVDPLFNNAGHSNIEVFKIKGSLFDWHCDKIFGQRSLLICILFLNDDCGHIEIIGHRKIFPKAGKLLILPFTWTYIYKHVYSGSSENGVCVFTIDKY